MTKLLDNVIAKVRTLPEGDQDAAAVAMLDQIEALQQRRLTDDQIAEVHRRLANPAPLISIEDVRARSK